MTVKAIVLTALFSAGASASIPGIAIRHFVQIVGLSIDAVFARQRQRSIAGHQPICNTELWDLQSLGGTAPASVMSCSNLNMKLDYDQNVLLTKMRDEKDICISEIFRCYNTIKSQKSMVWSCMVGANPLKTIRLVLLIKGPSCLEFFVLTMHKLPPSFPELVHCLYKKLQTCLPTSRRPAKPYLIKGPSNEKSAGR